MTITLEMVDAVIKRTNVGYKAAQEALEQTGGDILAAIIELESKQTTGAEKGHYHLGHQISEWLKYLINEGLIRQLTIVKNDKIVLDIPIMAGAIAGVLFTKSTMAAIIAAVATGCDLNVVKKDGEVINLNSLTIETFESLKAFFKCEGKEAEPSLQTVEPVVQS